jgi:hypothetical protein
MPKIEVKNEAYDHVFRTGPLTVIACPTDSTNLVFGYQEPLFPAHKDESAFREGLLANGKSGTTHLGFDGCAKGHHSIQTIQSRQRTSKRVEAAPMGHIVHLRGAIALGEKAVLGACMRD